MTRILAYTVHGDEHYTNPAIRHARGLLTDLDESVHFALSAEGGPFEPLRHGTGVVFATADFASDRPDGTTRTVVDPWLLEDGNGGYALLAVRRPHGTPGRPDGGELVVFRSTDLVTWTDETLIEVPLQAGEGIRHPRVRWSADEGAFLFAWEVVPAPGGSAADDAAADVAAGAAESRWMTGTSRTLATIEDAAPAVRPTRAVADSAPAVDAAADVSADLAIPGAVPGNTLEITVAQARLLRDRLGVITHTGHVAPQLAVHHGATLTAADLPARVTCTYSDGSTHDKPVDWDPEALAAIDTSVPGEHRVAGRIRRHDFPFPFREEPLSDPCIAEVDGRLLLTASDDTGVRIRAARTLEGLRDAEAVEVLRIAREGETHVNIWAQEIHVVGGVPWVFTTIGRGGWTTVQCVVARCTGDPLDPTTWEEPRRVVRAGGGALSPTGISLDMTYFEDAGRHYVMWSDRQMLDPDPENTVAGSADILIATIDPAEPWRLTSDPVTILRPQYGWDRCETSVDEGPYLLRRGDNLWVTISGSSTGLPDLYAVGLLRATTGADLLDPAVWDWQGYPALTKECVPGEFGPGHNAFWRDPATGDDLMIYHAVPHDDEGRSLGRRMGVRRVHWAADGRPCLEMSAQRDLDPALEQVDLTITVR